VAHYFWKMYFVYFLLMLLGFLAPIAILLWIGYRLAYPWEVPMPPWLRTLFIVVASSLVLVVIATIGVALG